MKTIIFLLYSSIVVSLSLAQQPLDEDGCPGACDATTVLMSNEKLVGIWYLHASIPRFFEEDMKCTFINVTEMEEDHLYFVKHEFNNNTYEPRETFGAIEFSRGGATNFYYTDHYWILATCNECGFYSSDGSGLYAYVFTRLQYPPCEMNSEIVDILNECGIDDDFLIGQDQNNCNSC